MNLTKKDRSRKLQMPIYRDCDVLTLASAMHEELDMDDCTIEMEQDDDIDTDEEVLCSGVEQCHADLRDLRRFIRENKHFRAETAVIAKWKRRGFVFNQRGTSVVCTVNHDTDIFGPIK